MSFLLFFYLGGAFATLVSTVTKWCSKSVMDLFKSQVQEYNPPTALIVLAMVTATIVEVIAWPYYSIKDFIDTVIPDKDQKNEQD